MLFDKDRHDSLTTAKWKPEVVQEAIREIIDDIELSLLPGAYWPTHPLDAEIYPDKGPKWSAYAGAAGAIHALQILRNYGYNCQDLSHLLPTVYQSYLKHPDVTVEPGLQIGEIGILLPYLLAYPGDKEVAQTLLRCMKETIGLPFYEITSEQSGMMHIAWELYRKTGRNCWLDMYKKGACDLLNNWIQDEDTSEWLWQSSVFGLKRHYYGACHGIAGNANILLQGADSFSEDPTPMILDRTIATLMSSAVRDENFIN